ncbi:MAG TPA: IS1595 family transposase [Rhizomicrobium sp.]
MSQHFLLSAKAATLSLTEVARMSDDEAHGRFRAVRFAENGGEPFCPHCGSLGVYEFECRKIFKCKGCLKQFSLTSGTIFANRKMAVRDILAAIAVFVNGVNGVAALRLRRELKCNYRSAYVLAHKLREVFSAQRTPHKLTGIVEIDGLWTGGHMKKTNLVKDRQDRRKSNPKRQSIVSLRERRKGGRVLTFVFRHESEAIATIIAHVHKSARIRVDDAGHWKVLDAYFADVKSVDHTNDGYAVDGVHTNLVESFNGRIRRGIRGVHSRITGNHLQGYADEFAWREDHRRYSNGAQFALLLRGAANHPISREWAGYWQRGPSFQKDANT